MNLKVLYVAPLVSPRDNPWFSPGRFKKIQQVNDLLSRAGYTLELINTAPFTFDSPNCKVFNLCTARQSLFRYYQLVFNAVKFCLHYKSDSHSLLIWVYNTRLPELIFLIISSLFLSNLRFVIQVEDVAAARSQVSALSRAVDAISAFVFIRYKPIHVFAVSEVVAQKFSQIYKFPLHNISCLPPLLCDNYLNLCKLRTNPFSSNTVNVVYAGGYEAEKGVDDLIAAFLLAIGKGFNATLTLIGSAPTHLLEKYSNNSLIIFKGILSEYDLTLQLLSADVLVNPHRPILNSSHIFPYKTIEMLASGSLPLTTRMPGIDSFGLPPDCFFSGISELSSKLLNSRLIWTNKSAEILNLAENTRKYYSMARFIAMVRPAVIFGGTNPPN